jgi:drug/metabolite transporter (DMT)-like permease
MNTASGCTVGVIILAFGMLLTGTVNTVLNKMVIGIAPSEGCCGWQPNGFPNDVPHNFQHPWFQTLIMFIGEFLCVIPFLIYFCGSNRGYQSINDDKKEENPFHYVFALTTTCDLVASTLGNISLLWVPASIWQMMRGSIIIFSGVLSVLFLKRVLKPFNWFGMSVVLFGLVCVGLSTLLKTLNDANNNTNDKNDTFLTAIGILLVLGAQLIAATQMVIQEFLLKKRNYHTTNVVFMEGFWGCLIMISVVLPITYLTPDAPVVGPPYTNASNATINPAIQIYHENSIDAMFQLSKNSTLLILELCIIVSIASFNIFGLSVTKSLSAVHRTLIDTCRTIFVWGVQVLLYLIDPITFANVGEKLTIYSLVQLFGFIFLIMGTLIYNQIIKLPFLFNYETEEKKKN